MPNFGSNRTLREFLTQASADGLVLVVGAGINGRAAPMWNEIVGKLIRSSLADVAVEDPSVGGLMSHLTSWCQGQFDPVGLATLAKYVLGDQRYRAELQQIVYSQTDEAEVADPRRSPAVSAKMAYLTAVAELACLPVVRAVATFNFDTFLEAAVNALGRRPAVAHFGPVKIDPRHSAGTGAPHGAHLEAELPVYHVHGLLPSPGSIRGNVLDPVVFAYDEYFDANADPLAWETSTVIHLLRSYCTLWLGASMRDWNMLRLLDAAHAPGQLQARIHCLQCTDAVVDRADQTKGDPFVRAALRLQATLLAAVGARLILAGDQFDELPSFLTTRITHELRRAANHSEEGTCQTGSE